MAKRLLWAPAAPLFSAMLLAGPETSFAEIDETELSALQYRTIATNLPPWPNTQVAKYEELKAAYPEVKAGRDRIIDEDLKAFNDLYSELKLPAILMSGGQAKPDTETDNTTESED